jgi:hypothetical protein
VALRRGGQIKKRAKLRNTYGWCPPEAFLVWLP